MKLLTGMLFYSLQRQLWSCSWMVLLVDYSTWERSS